MRQLRTIVPGAAIAALIALAPTARSAEPDPLARFTAEQRARLLAGEAVFEHVRTSSDADDDAGHGRALVLIDAPLDRCVAIFAALGEQHRYFPRKTASAVVETAGNRTWLRSTYDYSVRSIGYTVRYTHHRSTNRFAFVLDKRYPHDIEELEGYFEFTRVEDGCTLLAYVVTRLESGLRVPAFIRRLVTRNDLPALVLNVKRRIESNGRWSK